MPYVIDVGIEGDRPGKDDGVEVPFIDKFLNEGGPFHRADMHRDTQRLELALDDDRRLDARIVALIDEDGKQERLAIPLKEAVLILFPASSSSLRASSTSCRTGVSLSL